MLELNRPLFTQGSGPDNCVTDNVYNRARSVLQLLSPLPPLFPPLLSQEHYSSVAMSRLRAPQSLPTELWFQVIRQLPSRDQKSCLSVSKVLHDISQTFVFSHIIVRFGLWRNTKPNEDWTDEQKAEAARATRLSLELLQHVTRTPDLVRAVTRITVRAYTPPGDSHSVELMSE